MGWGAALGIGARKRAAESWFVARWRYHAAVGASAKRFQEKRVVKAGKNAAIAWRLVADQRPVRDAVQRLIAAKQRKRDADFCHIVWGEWRHQIWLSFRVYLGSISARASLIKYSFAAWYTLWCREVYGPKCMSNAARRLSCYRALGVWMDAVEEECSWKEEELAKRMLTQARPQSRPHEPSQASRTRNMRALALKRNIVDETWRGRREAQHMMPDASAKTPNSNERVLQTLNRRLSKP